VDIYCVLSVVKPNSRSSNEFGPGTGPVATESLCTVNLMVDLAVGSKPHVLSRKMTKCHVFCVATSTCQAPVFVVDTSDKWDCTVAPLMDGVPGVSDSDLNTYWEWRG